MSGRVPAGLPRLQERLVAEVQEVQGHLTPREIRFLALLAALPTAPGEVLEIGSFKGKSTVVLARGVELAGEERMTAVDPLTAPASSDPDLGPASSSRRDFLENLRRAAVEDRVEFHQTTSARLARRWDRPLRLLWIDGDHSYAGAKADFDGFRPHLSDGGIVAIHDVLQPFPGCIRVFMEDILLSPHFGPAGLCGTVGWAQVNRDSATSHAHRREKGRLFRRLARVAPDLVLEDHPLTGLHKLLYKLRRAAVPHGAVDPERWADRVRLSGRDA